MGAWSKSFSDYKPNYLSRCNKSAKSTFFGKLVSHGFISIGVRRAENSSKFKQKRRS